MDKMEAMNRTQLLRNGEAGMTLIEVMIVIVILGLLTAIAFPMYQDQMIKARRSDGHTLLMDMAARMERYYFDNTSYTTNLTALGYSDATNVSSVEGYYTAAATGCPIASCYSITASPANAQLSDTYCDELTLNSQGQKSISGSGDVNRCW